LADECDVDKGHDFAVDGTDEHRAIRLLYPRRVPLLDVDRIRNVSEERVTPDDFVRDFKVEVSDCRNVVAGGWPHYQVHIASLSRTEPLTSGVRPAFLHDGAAGAGGSTHKEPYPRNPLIQPSERAVHGASAR
jgi:hypothetical protein